MSIPLLPVLGSLFNVAAGQAAAPVRQAAATPTVPLATATARLAGTPSPGATAAVASTTPAAGATAAVASTTPAAGATATAAPAVAPTSAPPAVPPTPSPFSADYFTQAAQSGLGLLSTGFLLLSAILLGAGAYFYFVGRNQWRRSHRLNYNVASFWSLAGMILGGVGLLFTIFRILGLDGVNQRVWLYLVLIVWIGFAIYAAYYFLRVYPAKLAEFQRTHKPPRGGAARPQPARAPAARVANPNAPPERPAGAPGNPRGTSPRGERRRAKKR